MTVREITTQDFTTEVLESPVPTLVDFYATWCGPCKQLAPILDQVALERAGRLNIVKVDIETSPELANQFGVQSVPTLVLIKDGALVRQTAGAPGKAALLETLDSAI